MRYNLLPFTDTNSVICKIYVVGADAHIRLRVDVGIDPYEKRRKIYYESNWHCQKSGRPWSCGYFKGDPPHHVDLRGSSFAHNIDTF